MMPDEIGTAVTSKSAPARSFVFTSWHVCAPTEYKWAEMGVKYAVWQVKKSPTSGKFYHQGYVELNKPQRYAALKKKCPNPERMCFGARKGSPAQARAYCMKAETRVTMEEAEFGTGPWEFGEFVESAAAMVSRESREKEAIEGILTHARAGRQYEWLLNNSDSSFVRKYKASIQLYTKSVAEANQVKTKPRTKLAVLQGEGGTGKSIGISLFLDPKTTYHKGNSQGKFWDGYDPDVHDTVVFEETGRGSLSLALTKELASTNITRLKMKHKPSVPCLIGRMILISNEAFENVFPEIENPVQKASLIRRVDFYSKFTKGLSEYKGFSMLRMRFQNVDCPGSGVIEWLGCWYPLHNTSFESRFNIGLEEVGGADSKEGREAMRNKDTIRMWTKLTWWFLEESLRECCLSEEARTLIMDTPADVKRLQAEYDATERRIYRYLMGVNLTKNLTFGKRARPHLSVYDEERYDLVPRPGRNDALLLLNLTEAQQTIVDKENVPSSVTELFDGDNNSPGERLMEIMKKPQDRRRRLSEQQSQQ